MFSVDDTNAADCFDLCFDLFGIGLAQVVAQNLRNRLDEFLRLERTRVRV
jgi:hypothetical protein